MSTKYLELCRHPMKLSPTQERLKDLYGNLLLLLNHVDWDQPYAVDLEHIYTKCQERCRLTENLPPKQRQEISIVPFIIVANEALQIHKKALDARDWNNIDYTLRQLEDMLIRYNNWICSNAPSSWQGSCPRVYNPRTRPDEE